MLDGGAARAIGSGGAHPALNSPREACEMILHPEWTYHGGLEGNGETLAMQKFFLIWPRPGRDE